MSQIGFLVPLLAGLVAACVVPSPQDGNAAVDQRDLETFLATASDLTPCTVDEVSSRLGIQLKVEIESRSWTFYTGTGRGVISRYELRVPRPGVTTTSETALTPKLTAILARGAVRYDDITARLGPPVPESFEVQPAGGPTVFYEAFEPGRNVVVVGAGLDDPRPATNVIVECR